MIHHSLNYFLQKEHKKILFISDNLKEILNFQDSFRDNYDIQTTFFFFDIEYFTTQKLDVIIFDTKNSKQLADIIIYHIETISQKSDIPIIVLVDEIDTNLFQILSVFENLKFVIKPYSPYELRVKIDKLIDYNNLSDRVNYQQLLLMQYKDAIDESTIVSKTNPKGRIIYVNDAFCQMSGYTQEELLGRPHNIVRHPDTPQETFAHLWFTIKNKKETWHGVVKNRKKDGSAYFVKSYIVPIVDNNNDIVEYISIRTDITSEMTMMDYFENQFKISTKNFEHAFHLQKEYENALNSSNILSRTDATGRIIFVNEEFVELTGYREDELLGHPHNIIRDPDIPKEHFAYLWKTIKQGEIWKGIIKNRKKNGEPFWVASSIIPIKNEENRIIEYMAIRHDLTELFTLHKEIELTQKEIIYKMGEIGESRSKETGNHVKRVAEYSKLLALLYGLSDEEAQILLTASPMHDIGKVAIPDNILKKPAKLDDDEWEVMKTHTTIGCSILQGSNREILKAAAIVANEHHEKWDGSGYPRGLSGENIHIYGRITALADVFDALGSDRCYKKAWEDEEIFALFRRESGKHFEPKLVELFFDNLLEFLKIRDKFVD